MARYVPEQPVTIPIYGQKTDAFKLAGSDSGPATSPKDELRKALEHRHPEYEKYEKAWTRQLDCYVGDIEKMREYIYTHEREHSKNYSRRTKRVAYVNYCEPVVDLYISYIFRRPIVRKPLGDLGLPASMAMLKQIQAQQATSPNAPAQLAPGEQLAGSPEQSQAVQPPTNPGQKQPVLPATNGAEEAPPEMYSPAEQPDMSEISSELAMESLNYFIAMGGPQQLAIFNELYKDADLRGNSLDRFMQDVGRDAQIAGYAGILVDAPAIKEDEQPETEAQRKERKIRPYLVPIKCDDIVDWELDEFGKFTWLRIKEETSEDREPFEAEEKKVTDYYTYTKDEWFKHRINEKGDVEELDQGTNPLGEVPLVRLYNKRKKNCQIVGDSAIDDISVINIAMMNWLSMLDEEVYQKCLSILTMKATMEDRKEIELSSKNVLEYPEDQPAFIAPSTEPWQFILEMLNQSVEEIYRIARMGGGGSGIQISEAKSGIAYAYEFNQTNQALSDKADQLELAELEIHRLYAKWWGFEFTGKINYADEFGVEDLAQEMEFLTASRSAITSLTAKRELEKRVVKKLLQSQVDEKTMQRMLAEIDANRAEDYKVPGEFMMPGVPEKASVPGGDATSMLAFLDELEDPQLLQRLGNEMLNKSRGKKTVPRAIKTVPRPNVQ
jgi:hypothetical protein